MSTSIPEAIGQLYAVLLPFSSVERQRLINSVMAALGDWDPSTKSPVPLAPTGHTGHHDLSGDGVSHPLDPRESALGKNVRRWMSQHQVSIDGLFEVFHLENGECRFIGIEMPGSSTKFKVANCYLMAGLCAFLVKDEAVFSDADAVALCKHFQCHDGSNHSSYRKQGGNLYSGDKERGFSLTAPGFRAAADLVKSIAS